MGGDERMCGGLILLRNRCGASPFSGFAEVWRGCLALAGLCLDPRVKPEDDVG